MGIIQTTKELRPRQENDFYPTPIELCRAALSLVETPNPWTILDPGCGSGVWGEAAREFWPKSEILGVDIVADTDLKLFYNGVIVKDFRDWIPSPRYELIMGNPPYKYAEEFIRNSWTSLRAAGEMIFLLRLAFLEGQKRCQGLWKEIPPQDVYVLGRRPSFTGNGKTDATAYAIFRWVFDTPVSETKLHWLDWDYDK